MWITKEMISQQMKLTKEKRKQYQTNEKGNIERELAKIRDNPNDCDGTLSSKDQRLLLNPIGIQLSESNARMDYMNSEV